MSGTEPACHRAWRRSAAGARHTCRCCSRCPARATQWRPDREHVFQSYAITVGAPLQRDRVAIALRERGIGCNIGTYASHLQPIYATPDDTPAPCPTSARLFREHLALPMHAELSDSDVDHVVAVLGEVID